MKTANRKYSYDPLSTLNQMVASGFITDMPNDIYHQHEGISKSGLDKVERSPAHYKYAEPIQPTRGMEMGTAIHTAILEPQRFQEEYVITEAEKRTEKAYKETKSIVGGERALTAPEGKKIQGMRHAVENNPEAMRHLTDNGMAEVTAICTDPETGVKIRSRFDWLVLDTRVAVDLKKTQDIRSYKFRKSIENYRYHVQAAMYDFVYQQITGEPLQAFYFLAVEEEVPHSTAMYQLSSDALEVGHFYFRRDLRTYAQCLESGHWPHPDNNDGIIELSNWAINAFEDDLEVIL